MRVQASIEFDLSGIIVDANSQFLELMGYDLSEVKGQHHSIFVEADYAASQDYRQFWEKLRAGRTQTAEFKRVTKQGAPVWLQASYIPLFDRRGRVSGVLKIAQDTTERKMRDREYESQIEALDRSQATVEFDLSGNVLDANANFLDLMGYTLDEVRGRHHRLFVEPGEANGEQYKAFWNALRSGRFQSAEFRRICKDGSEVWIQGHYNPVFDLNGEPIKIVKFATDITAQVHQRFAAERLSLVADGTDNSVIITDVNGRCEYVNAGYTKMTGYTSAETLGQKPGALLQGKYTDPETIQRIRANISAREPFYDEILNYTKNGEAYWISLSINPIFDKNGDISKFISVQADITETKMLARENATRLASIWNSTAVANWSADGVLLDASPLLLNMLGYRDIESAASSLNLAYDALMTGDQCDRILGGESVDINVRLRDAAGNELWVDSTFNSIFGVEGDLTKITLYADDVSERQRTLAQVGNIAATINNLARQTHVLSLNATVEAARAGQAGRGFAVLATEVRALAGRSTDAAGQIGQMLEDA